MNLQQTFCLLLLHLFIFFRQVQRKQEWDNYEAVLTEPKLMVVTDASVDG